MKKLIPSLLILCISLISVIIACNDKNEDPEVRPTGEQTEYQLEDVNDSGVSGTVLFEEMSDMSVRIMINLTGTQTGGDHPTHIHNNSAAEGGGIALDLTNVDGATGTSETVVTLLNDGTSINYEALTTFDGYINVHSAPDNLSTLLAQGDIGSNELTGESVEYEMKEVNDSGISGTATFYERISEETLVVIDLSGDDTDSDRPTHIHNGSVSSPGGIAINLNNVKSGFSRTNVSELNDGTPINYGELTTFEGYVNVHNAEGDLGTLKTQGNIGSSVGAIIGYTVSNSGTSAYVFNGNSLTNSSNPNITLKRGNTYTFTVDATGHPFWIKTSQSTGSGNAYNNGVTNNGESNGTITFMVPNDAPSLLYYNCEFHDSMTGQIMITD